MEEAYLSEFGNENCYLMGFGKFFVSQCRVKKIPALLDRDHLSVKLSDLNRDR